MQETILILDFGSQYTQLIARRLRELNVYCEIHPWNKIPFIGNDIKGVILSGSPFSVRDENSPKPDLSAIKGNYCLCLEFVLVLNIWRIILVVMCKLPKRGNTEEQCLNFVDN
jgi:hypothetical protein